jgi:hypothetical protein
MSLHFFAGLRVRDFQAARPWYERLLGKPTFFPHATEAVWTLAEGRSVYVVEHADGFQARARAYPTGVPAIELDGGCRVNPGSVRRG